MPGNRECVKWNADAAEEIIRMKPDAVFTNGSRNVRAGLTEETPSGFIAQWRKLEKAEIPVIAAREPETLLLPTAVCRHARTRGAAMQCVTSGPADTGGSVLADRGPAEQHILFGLQRLLLHRGPVPANDRQRAGLPRRQPRERHVHGNHEPDRGGGAAGSARRPGRGVISSFRAPTVLGDGSAVR